MSEKSNIEWTDATWPVVQGCDPVSQGCVHCYAVPLLWRMMHHPDPKISGPLQGLVERHTNAAGETILRFTGKVALREDRLTWPLQWTKPRMIFVPSHGDLFHKNVPDEFIDRVFAVMALCPQHTFQVLTKRSERMREYVNSRSRDGRYLERQIIDAASEILRARQAVDIRYVSWNLPGWPLPNVWLGVSAERQQEADERIPHLLQTPAAVRFVSLEPLLGPIKLYSLRHSPDDYWPRWDALKGFKSNQTYTAKIDWVIVGGESGKGARPMHPQWARDIRDQCDAARVAFFFKQWGEHQPLAAKSDPPHLREMRGIFTDRHQYAHGYAFLRVGKKAAGRLLDGREHDAMPSCADTSPPVHE